MQRSSGIADHLFTLASGVLFGFGLAWATMIRPESVLAFLTFHDLGLLLVLGSAVGVNLLVFQLLPRFSARALLGGEFETRPFALSRQTLFGGFLFGLGWGICGVCPGPALAGFGAGLAFGNFDLLTALVGIFLGALLQGLWAGRESDDSISHQGNIE